MAVAVAVDVEAVAVRREDRDRGRRDTIIRAQALPLRITTDSWPTARTINVRASTTVWTLKSATTGSANWPLVRRRTQRDDHLQAADQRAAAADDTVEVAVDAAVHREDRGRSRRDITIRALVPPNRLSTASISKLMAKDTETREEVQAAVGVEVEAAAEDTVEAAEDAVEVAVAAAAVRRAVLGDRGRRDTIILVLHRFLRRARSTAIIWDVSGTDPVATIQIVIPRRWRLDVLD